MIKKKQINEFIDDNVMFTVLDTATIQNIKDPVALAVWVYLCSKPQDWVVRRQEVRCHFSMSQEKIAKCFNLLIDLGLLVIRKNIRSDAGRFGGSDYSVCNSGVMSLRGSIEIPEIDNPRTGKPCNGNPGTYIDREYTNNKNIQITRDTKKENITKRKKITESDERFELFYSQYPKKVGKIYAQKMFARLCKTDQLALLGAMPSVVGFYAGSEKQYIPNPSTFINQRRWEDDLSYSQNPSDDIGF